MSSWQLKPSSTQSCAWLRSGYSLACISLWITQSPHVTLRAEIPIAPHGFSSPPECKKAHRDHCSASADWRAESTSLKYWTKFIKFPKKPHSKAQEEKDGVNINNAFSPIFPNITISTCNYHINYLCKFFLSLFHLQTNIGWVFYTHKISQFGLTHFEGLMVHVTPFVVGLDTSRNSYQRVASWGPCQEPS